MTTVHGELAAEAPVETPAEAPAEYFPKTFCIVLVKNVILPIFNPSYSTALFFGKIQKEKKN